MICSPTWGDPKLNFGPKLLCMLASPKNCAGLSIVAPLKEMLTLGRRSGIQGNEFIAACKSDDMISLSDVSGPPVNFKRVQDAHPSNHK